MALLLILVLASAVAGTFGMVGSEGRAIGDYEAQVGAYDLARSAFDRFIANPTAALPSFTPPTSTGPDSAYFSFSNGYAYVRIQRIRPTTDATPALYLIRSRGVRTAFRSGNTPAGERIYAQYAQYQKGLSVLAAWTSLAGMRKNGGAGVISGVDACGKEPTIAGVAVPTIPGYVQIGGASTPSGSPNILDMGLQTQANSMMTLNWSGISAGTALPPDVKYPGGVWPSFADPTYWPVIYVDQATTWSLPGSGRGIIIVRNNMIINNGAVWDGVILVGGLLTSNGDQTVSGAVMTGLNMLLGIFVPPSDLGNGNKTYVYNSCAVASATARFRGLSPLRNTTADNWASY
jgi:hypothetical protein